MASLKNAPVRGPYQLTSSNSDGNGLDSTSRDAQIAHPTHYESKRTNACNASGQAAADLSLALATGPRQVGMRYRDRCRQERI